MLEDLAPVREKERGTDREGKTQIVRDGDNRREKTKRDIQRENQSQLTVWSCAVTFLTSGAHQRTGSAPPLEM
jgi:hypothetical protein